jgi:ribonuclease-3
MKERNSSSDLLPELEMAINYRFVKRGILLEALTHRSFVHESADSRDRDNQRLEFFGDAVIGLHVSEKLLDLFPEADEGQLSKLRAFLVSEKTLSRLAGNIDLGKYLRLGRGEEKTGGREKNSVLADAYEALVAAVYLDGGAAAAEELVERDFGPLLIHGADLYAGKDYKTRLQEKVQELYGAPPRYILEKQAGPPHERIFSVAVLAGEKRLGEGAGKSKKEAEQAAARVALVSLSAEKAAESPWKS